MVPEVVGEALFVLCFGRQADSNRKLAGRVLRVRNRPEWLLLSLIVVSVAIAEVLPYFWGHLFISGSHYSYITTNLIIGVSQVGPCFIKPQLHLEITGRFIWFIRLIMWLTSPVIVLPAYALRQIRVWRRRGEQTLMDGLLPLDELKEFIRLHERGQGAGGMVDNHVGEAMRSLLAAQISGERSSRHVETERPWSIPLSGSIASTSVHSLRREGSMAIDAESTVEPATIRPHNREGSTAIEDAPAPGLRKRGERSTEGHEPVVPVVSVPLPQQALIKDPIYNPQTSANDSYVEKGLPQRRDMPRRLKLLTTEPYGIDRKSNGLVTDVTDSFLFERRW